MPGDVQVKQVRPETGKQVAKTYEPTPRELRALSAQENRRQQRHPDPSMKVTGKGNSYSIKVDHEDNDTSFRLMMESLGTSNTDFATVIIAQLASLNERGGKVEEMELNGALERLR